MTTRRHLWAAAAAAAFLLLLLGWSVDLRDAALRSQGRAITVAGLEHRSESRALALFGVTLFLAAWLIRPGHRIATSGIARAGRAMSAHAVQKVSLPNTGRFVTVALLVCASITSCATDPKLAGRSALKRGDAHFAAKKYKEAILEYRRAIAADPASGEAHDRLARSYVQAMDPAGAYREYLIAADLMPGRVEAQIKAGNMLLLGRQFAEARSRADKVLASDPGNVQGHVLRANVFAALKDFESGLAELDTARTLDPNRGATYESLGALQLAKGDLAAAREAFTRASHLDRTSSSALRGLAMVHLSSERVSEAEEALKQAVAVDPSDLAANRLLARLYVTSNRTAAAEPYLKRLAMASTAVSAQLLLADYYSLVNRFNDAGGVLQTIGPDDQTAFAAAQTRLAAIEYSTGKATEARRRIEALLARQPHCSAALLLKGRLLLAEHRWDEALASTQAAVQADPAFTEAHFFLGRLYAQAGEFERAKQALNEVLKLAPRATAARLELGRVHLAEGSVKSALQTVREAMNEQPDNPDARLLLARCLSAAGDLVHAATELQAVLVEYPNSSLAHAQMGSLLLAQGAPAAARAAFERALQIDDASLPAVAGLISLDLAAKNTMEAQARVETRLLKAPRDPRLLLLGAGVYATTGDSIRAEQMLQRVLADDPSNLQARAMLGRVLLSQHKLEPAKAEFERLATRRPGSQGAIAAQTLAALVLEAQNRPGDARDAYERILSASPRAVVPANNLAWLYAEHGGNLDVALGLAQTAASQAPERPEVSDTLGWIYYKKGLPSLALPALRQSVEKDSTNALYHYHLGLAYAKSGDRARARQSLERALALEDQFSGSSHAREVLASLHP